MATRNALIIGSNRGLGLGLLKVFKEHGYNVFGTIRPQTRSDPSFKDLEATGATVIDLDYLDEDSIAAAAQCYGHDRPLDYRVMTVGPFLASKYFLPSLRRSEFGKIVNITSEWASIAANDCGTHISYRVPKSALNALSISVAIELRAAEENIAVLCVDPGDVPTKLSRWAGDIDLNDSVRGMYEQIDKATIEDTGLFVNWRGHKWPY
ncbi:short chain dehydrogenase [Cordyceps militaris]|uniref:Short chain dehydrogenase n=1 Tax=Cordyceps militaris TaxID=73501 RepID=A0A2H4SS05_CORMI|nr:short chain dehydrogenase [Cordyceps militaris]